MNDYEYELIGESIWNIYEDIAYIMVEKSITAMHRAGEFKDDDIPITPRAKYKQRRSLERAEETLKRADRKQIYKNPGRSIRGNPPPSKRAKAALERHPKKAARLRVPKPLEAEDTTHKMAAVVSRVGESVWNTYSDMAYIIVEGRRLRRVAGIAALGAGAVLGGHHMSKSTPKPELSPRKAAVVQVMRNMGARAEGISRAAEQAKEVQTTGKVAAAFRGRDVGRRGSSMRDITVQDISDIGAGKGKKNTGPGPGRK